MDDSSVFEEIAGDEHSRVFLTEDFDLQQYTNSVIEGQQIAQALHHLASSVSLLDKELQEQVVAHHEDLLSQATGVEKLEGVLEMMQSRIKSLQAGVARIRAKITEPYAKIMKQTTQLARLQAACELLRRVIRVLHLRKRLRAQLDGGPREIVKSAQSLNELDYLSQGVDLSGIEVLDVDSDWVSRARANVLSQAESMLQQGLEMQYQGQIGTALLVFHQLNNLSNVVQRVLRTCLDQLQEDIRRALDPNTLNPHHSGVSSESSPSPGRAAVPVAGSSAARRAALWTRLEKLMDKIYASCSQTFQLYKVLVKRRDPHTHVCFIEELDKDGRTPLMLEFWRKATDLLRNQFDRSAGGSTFIRQALEGEYPKLLRLVKNLWARLQQLRVTDVAVPSGSSSSFTDHSVPFPYAESPDFDPELALRKALGIFETAYLARSLSQLFDPINLIFPAGSKIPPAAKDLTAVVKAAANELNVASSDPILLGLVAGNVTKMLQLYLAKCDQLMSHSREAKQIADRPNKTQQCNRAVANSIFALREAVHKVVSTVVCSQPSVLQPALDALQSLRDLEESIVGQLVDEVDRTVEAILVSMHDDNWTGRASSIGQPDTPCSGYISELKAFIARIKEEHMKAFECKDYVERRLRQLATHILEVFVRHASLIRPLEEKGRLRLAADMAQVELAVNPFCTRASDLGRPYRLLRAFRPLLFCSHEDIDSNLALGDTLPYSLVLDYLFSYAPHELKSPHQVAEWSEADYAKWIQGHSEKDHLQLINATLEGYVKGVRSRGMRQFAPVYATMVKVLKRATEQPS